MTDMHVLPGAGAPAEPVHRPTRFYRFAAIVSWPVVFGLYRFKQRGLDKVPAAGGFVLAANHNSNFDPWPLGAAFFPGRYLRFMTKSELFWWPLKVLLEWGGAFPVNRKEADVKAIQTAVELCRCGHIVVMFPEGTRRRKGLRKRTRPKARPGAALIALRAGVPLVPAAVLGTDKLGRLQPLRVHYGEPIPLADLQGVELREAAQIATERLMAEIARLESVEY
jgi:1-acyl-sn-glycerol-3-phosphate acyltransferase